MAQYRDGVMMVLRLYFDSITIQVFVLAIAVLSCIIYVYQTYTHQESVELEIFFFTTFLFDYIMCYIEANRKLEYVLSPMGLADLASLAPFLGVFLGETYLMNIMSRT